MLNLQVVHIYFRNHHLSTIEIDSIVFQKHQMYTLNCFLFRHHINNQATTKLHVNSYLFSMSNEMDSEI